MGKYDNIVISMNYIGDICYEQYKKSRNNILNNKYSSTGVLIGTPQDEFPENIPSDRCDSWYKKLYIAIQKNTSAEEKNTPKNQAIEKIMNQSGVLSHSDKLALYCDTNSSGIIDCPGLPRSIYKDTPW